MSPRHNRVLFTVLVAAIACSDRAAKIESTESVRSTRTVELARVAAMDASPPMAAPAPQPAPTQRLIRSATLRIEVPNVARAMQLADSMLRTRNALVADTRVAQNGHKRHDAQLVIRVPADWFDATLASLPRDVDGDGHLLHDVSDPVDRTRRRDLLDRHSTRRALANSKFAPHLAVVSSGGSDEKERPAEHPGFLAQASVRTRPARREAHRANAYRRSRANLETPSDIGEVRSSRHVATRTIAGLPAHHSARGRRRTSSS